MPVTRPLLLAAALLLPAVAGAQQAPATGSSDFLSGLGGKSGLLGGMMPSTAATPAGNAAGVLSYCVKNKLVGSQSGAQSILGKLTGQKQVTQSPGFAAGQLGTLQTGRNQSLSLAGMKGKLKSKVCDLVLKRAGSFI